MKECDECELEREDGREAEVWEALQVHSDVVRHRVLSQLEAERHLDAGLSVFHEPQEQEKVVAAVFEPEVQAQRSGYFEREPAQAQF